MPDIRDLYARAGHWHGTGRYKYGDTDGVVDILEGIIQNKGLTPHHDDWDRKRGGIRSISLGRARMYARLYAGMYMPQGQRIGNEYGSRLVWGHWFFDTAFLVALAEYPFGKHILDYQRKLVNWTGKVSKKKHSLKSVFLEGTDIAYNYPILIGIRQGAISPSPGSRFFNLHEDRSEFPISIEDFTHVEVPETRVREVAETFRDAGFEIPVIPIEDGETYCRSFSFAKLVGGKPLIRP
ncbi:MAG: hypothetical protein WDN10_04055 [bacterium]